MNKEDFREQARQAVFNGDEDAAVEVANKVIAEKINLMEIMEPTRYTWPSFLWHLTHRVQNTIEGRQ